MQKQESAPLVDMKLFNFHSVFQLRSQFNVRKSLLMLKTSFFFSRKLRDEYDKLEGALRKLGVDPDTIVGNHSGMSSGPDAEDYLEGDLSQVSQSPF
jgi:hypothetical protein